MKTGNVRDANFKSASFEWPTWVVLVLTYSAWITLTWYWQSIPGWLLWLVGGFTVTLHSSLQHEALHGHPTRHKWFNIALVWPPLSLWMPVELYVENHLRHHGSDLTDPDLDPESFFVTREKWNRLQAWQQSLLIFNNTFAGRMLLGPWLTVGQLYRHEAARLLRGDFEHLGVMLRHAVSVVLVLYWIVVVCQLPFWVYLLAFAWPGTSMMMIRSFLEHRYDVDDARRTVLVDGCPLTRLMFLNNNYHWVHHHHPGLAWYRLPAQALREREQVLSSNGNYWYSGYFSIAWCYLFKPLAHPVHPAAETPGGTR